MKELLLINKYYYFSILLFIVSGGIILSLTTKDVVTLWVNEHWSLFLDRFIIIVNNGGTVVFSAVSVIVLWLWKDWRIALKASTCFLSVMIVTQFAKHVLFPGTPRPTLYFGPGVLRLIEGVKQLTTESFPSGHTSASFALATFFALYLPRKKTLWMLALLALAVSYGRIYMAQHFITDVYTGMLIGVTVTTLVYYFYPEKWEYDSKSQAIHRSK
jgi:membrane-associated phospholipid phosphatase